MTSKSVFVLSVLGVLASAQAGRAAPADGDPSQSLKDFAASHPDCHEWTDGCSVCVRGAGAIFHCSLPGIACLPKALLCHGKASEPVPLPSPPAPYLAPNPDDLNKSTPK